MNPHDMFDALPDDEREELTRLVKAAESLRPDEHFVKRTEMQLKDAFAAKKEKTMKRFNLLWQILIGTAAVAALTLGTIWLVRRVAPEPRNPAVSGEASPTPLPESTPLPEATLVPTPVTQACEKVSYEVQANDTLASIAENHSISVDELKSYNGLNTDMVFTGQSLIILVCKQYDWNGTTVYRAADFPQTPAKMSIYTHSADTPATIEIARKLAERFGIKGEVYLAPDFVAGSNSFLVTDGKQRLYVNSERRFSYQAGSDVSSQESPVSLDTASGPIDVFLKARGFDFAYQLETMSGAGSAWFHVIPLTPDGRPTRFDFSQADGIQVQVDPQGQVISLNASILNVNPQPVEQYSVISAEEAWQKVLQNAPLGMTQSTGSSPGAGRLLWLRIYPDQQPVIFSGSVTHFASAEDGKPPFISIDSYAAIGETAGLENLGPNVFVEARGQFVRENGIQKFKVGTWQVSKTGPQYFIGNLRNEGGKVIFSAQGTDYTLTDVPADVPIPVENIDVTGTVNGNQLDWQSIIYLKDGIRGGGGGGGGDFARLNLSGTPVVWPTPQPVTTPESPVGKRFESQQGILNVFILQKTDGSQRVEYKFAGPDGYFYTLQGQGLEKLQAYHNRPVLVWGTVTEYKSSQAPILTVERYEIPFPDLKFQLLRGTQKVVTLDGQEVVLFTTEDRKTYAQVSSDGRTPINSLIGNAGDQVFSESLLIPDETFGGYPAMRIFGGGLVNNPKNGQPKTSDEITADKPLVMPDTVQNNGTPPSLTIETIELVYYTVDPGYSASNPDATTPYIQPVWRFYGHYSDGSYMEILVQALKEEFLLPEAAPAVQGG